MDKIIFSEKLPAQSKNTSLTACRHTAAFMKCILLISILGIVYLTAAPLLAKAGILPFRYEYADNCHRFFTWSDIWYTEFTLPSDKFGQIINPLNGYLILGILKSILILLPFIFVLFFVKRILDRTLNGHSPFIRETEKALRKISLILIVVALFKNTLYYGLLEKFLFHSLSFRFPDISFEILAMGILSLILSEIFRYGIELQDEADMTI